MFGLPEGRQRVRVGVDTGPGLARDAFREECDVNWIVRRYQQTGLLEFQSSHPGFYEDVPSIDFQSALEMVRTAEALFAELPSNVRLEFQNDPVAFMDFAVDPVNLERLVDLGLGSEAATKAVMDARVAAQRAAEAPAEPPAG